MVKNVKCIVSATCQLKVSIYVDLCVLSLRADNGIPRPEVVEPVAAVAVVEEQVAGANGHAAIVEDKKIR